MAYRVDRQALERERDRLAQRVRELEARWTETFWREVAPARKVPAPGSLPSARDSEAEVAQLAARLEVLNELEAQWARVLVEWESPPPLSSPRVQLARPKLLAPWLRSALEPPFERFCSEVERAAGELPLGVNARYHQTRSGTFIAGHLVTTTPRGAARLIVRNESFTDDLRKLFGSKHDIQLGIDSFDGVFAIEGDEATARRVLDADTRAALLRMGERGPVAIRSGGGRAEIGHFAVTGSSAPDAGWLRSAIAVAGVLHRAPARPLRT